MASVHRGIIAWFVGNPVAANLLMLMIVAAGINSAFSLHKEIFPVFEQQSIYITALYTGAAPLEVEEGIILPIETALKEMQGIKKISATAEENLASIQLDLESGKSMADTLNQVKRKIDAIVNFPTHMEPPVITQLEPWRQAISVALTGDLSDKMRKQLGDKVRAELLSIPSVKRVSMWGVRDYEIAIEIQESRLREFGMTLDEVSKVVRLSSLNLPLGEINSNEGNILLRSQGQAYTGEDYRQLIVRSHSDGTQVRLGDIAVVTDGFTEGDNLVRFDRRPAINFGIQTTGEQDIFAVDEAVKTYIAQKSSRLPKGIEINYWADNSHYLKGCLSMMLNNLWVGALLVFLVLALFLNLHVASWVMIGIPISFLGALWLMPINPYPININMISLFGFILVLGVVVDDAIIVGESIFNEVHQHSNNHLANKQNLKSTFPIITGVKKVATPATFGVLTTVAAFLPLLWVGGQAAPFIESVCVVVIFCLAFSLVESKLILPAHLIKLHINPHGSDTILHRCRSKVDNTLHKIINKLYLPLLKMSLQYRNITLVLFLAGLILFIGAVRGGLIRYEFFPNMPNDFINVNLEMNDGASIHVRDLHVAAIEAAIYKINSDYRQEYPERGGFIKHLLIDSNNDYHAKFILELTKSEIRSVDSYTIANLWREKVGALVDVRKLKYSSGDSAGGGANITLQLSGTDAAQLVQASAQLEQKLLEYDGVFDIHNTMNPARREIQIQLKDEAKIVQLTLADVARQVRQGFYGEEIQRIQRQADTVKVMVRYPLLERRSITSLESMMIRTPSGGLVPIGTVVDIQFTTGLSAIDRVNNKRTATITADVDSNKVQTAQVITDIQLSYVPELLKQYPTVKWGLGGASQEQQVLIQRILIAFLTAILLIYALLAIPLRSYSQPLIVMITIPFGLIGALTGHLLLDVTLSMMSLFGMVALSGVVINDSLILMDFINRAKQSGESTERAVCKAGKKRFRAIFLTTLTTFVGLLPITLETSLQAQFVIPMAVSLGFGVVFGSLLTLLLIPNLYILFEDIDQGLKKTFFFSVKKRIFHNLTDL